MTTPLAFVDCETTGLDPRVHEVWEVALILRNGIQGPRYEKVWHLSVDAGRADPYALTINRFYERRRPDPYTPLRFAWEFAWLTHGAHLVGAVPSFDASFLAPLLRANGACPGWHYHLIDVEALAAGFLASRGNKLANPPWNSEILSRAMGVDPKDFDRHTALGDVRWAEAVYDAVMGGTDRA